jgi:hypothetical protein
MHQPQIQWGSCPFNPRSIQDNNAFLCSHTDFVVLDTIGQDADGPIWFDQRVREAPEFVWRNLDSFDTSYLPEVKRELIAVHRREPLAFCNKPWQQTDARISPGEGSSLQ